MATTFAAAWDEVSQATEEQLEATFLGAAQDTSEQMTRRVDGITMGGTFVVGYVPVGETSELINSQQLGINGGVVAEGAAAYEGVISGADITSVIQHVFTAAHARPVEYGYRIASDEDTDYSGDVDVPGRFYVAQAVQNWEETVLANWQYVKGQS